MSEQIETPDTTAFKVRQTGMVQITTSVPAFAWTCDACGWLGTGHTSERAATDEAVDHLWAEHSIAACDPNELGGHGPNGLVHHRWQRVKGTDSTDRCVRCGRYCGK